MPPAIWSCSGLAIRLPPAGRPGAPGGCRLRSGAAPAWPSVFPRGQGVATIHASARSQREVDLGPIPALLDRLDLADEVLGLAEAFAGNAGMMRILEPHALAERVAHLLRHLRI